MDQISANVEILRQLSANSESKSKANPEVVARQGEILFSAYRTADYADPRGFAVQLASVLSEFPDEVVIYVTSPQTGLQRRLKFPPTISEVLEACEQRQDFLRRIEASGRTRPQLVPPSTALERPPGYLANIFVPEGHPRYSSLSERTKSTNEIFWKFGVSKEDRSIFGLWVSLDMWGGR